MRGCASAEPPTTRRRRAAVQAYHTNICVRLCFTATVEATSDDAAMDDVRAALRSIVERVVAESGILVYDSARVDYFIAY